MRAMMMSEIAGPLSVCEVDDVEAPPDGVVVRVHATGLCRSDWHAWVGHENIALPHIPGHELAGVISAIGQGVQRWSVGDRVTVPFVCGCGRCELCLSGHANVCPDQQQPGFTHWGSFAELVAIHAADVNLVAIPDAVTFEAAAALGCRFATAFHALTARARVQPGEWVSIVGAGGVGLSAVMIAHSMGANLIAVDRNPAALEIARSLGAHEVVLADGIDVPQRIHDITGGGSHIAIDAVGSTQTSIDAILSLRRRGRHVQIGLLPTETGLSGIPMDRVIAWELDVFGSHGMSAVDYPAMLSLIENGLLRPQELITRVVGLSEAALLLEQFENASPVGMTMIDPRRG